MSKDGRKRILLVEDETLSAVYYANTLEKNGYDVRVSATGEEAIHLVAEGDNFDLILMDINLRFGMDGAQAASRILESFEGPLLFLSSHSEENVVQKTRGISSSGYIVKSSGEAVFLASIDMALGLFKTDSRFQLRSRRSAEFHNHQESLFLKTQEMAHVGTWEYNVANNTLFWSDEAYRIVGLVPQSNQFPYDEFIQMIHPDDREAVDQAYRGSIQSGSDGYEIDHRILRADNGQTRYLRERCIHIKDARGVITGSIGMVQDITEHITAQDRIGTLLKEKEILLKEAHHRIKNNMSTISSLLSLQADDCGNDTARALLRDAARRIQSMMVLYNTLYRSEHFDEVDLADFLYPLVDAIMADFPHAPYVKTELQVEPVILAPGTSSTVGIIVNELICNSMKYAFPAREGASGAIISLKAARVGPGFRLSYGDNGPGLPDGISLEHSTGFGLKLIGMLVEQMQGSARLESSRGMACVIDVGH